MAQVFFLCHDLHGPPAQDKAGARQHRIADLGGSVNPLFHCGDRLPLGLADPQRKQQFFKGFSVLGPLNGSAVCADDLHAPVSQGLGQVNGRLAA